MDERLPLGSNGRIGRPGGAGGMVDDALARGGDDRHGRGLLPVVRFPPRRPAGTAWVSADIGLEQR